MPRGLREDRPELYPCGKKRRVSAVTFGFGPIKFQLVATRVTTGRYLELLVKGCVQEVPPRHHHARALLRVKIVNSEGAAHRWSIVDVVVACRPPTRVA